jgi:hypothetical protein
MTFGIVLFADRFTLAIRDYAVENAIRLEDFDQYANVGRVRDWIIVFLEQLAVVGAVGEDNFDGGLGIPRGRKTHQICSQFSRVDCAVGVYQVGDHLGRGGGGIPHQHVVEVADVEVSEYIDDDCL